MASGWDKKYMVPSRIVIERVYSSRRKSRCFV